MNTPTPRNLNELIKLAKGTKYESVAGDQKKLEEFLLKEMKASSDPTIREIGSGIADGTMTWRTVATSSAYEDSLGNSMEALRRFDFGGVLEALVAEQEAAAQKPAEKPADRDRDVPEDDALFKGFRKRKPR